MSQLQAAIDELKRNVMLKVSEHPEVLANKWWLHEYVVLPSIVSQTLCADTHLAINIVEGQRAFFRVFYGDGQLASVPILGGLLHKKVRLDTGFDVALRIYVSKNQIGNIHIDFAPHQEYRANIAVLSDPNDEDNQFIDPAHIMIRPLELTDVELIEMCLDQI